MALSGKLKHCCQARHLGMKPVVLYTMFTTGDYFYYMSTIINTTIHTTIYYSMHALLNTHTHSLTHWGYAYQVCKSFTTIIIIISSSSSSSNYYCCCYYYYY